MQIEANKSKYNIINIICLCILATTLIFIMPGDKTPSEMQVAIFVQFGVVLLSVIGMLKIGDKSTDMEAAIALIIMLSSIIILFSIMIFQSSLTIYFDDCNEITLLDNGVDISRNDCINYAIENPDTTGAELIDHFKQKKIDIVKEKEITSVLERQLEP